MKKLIIISLLSIILLLAFFGNKYDRREYIIKVNNNNINYYLKENYNKTLIPYVLVSKNWIHEWNNVTESDSVLNEIRITKKVMLNFEEYICLNRYSKKKINCNISYTDENKPIKRNINNGDNHLKIERNGNILYNSNLISDISLFVKEPGRYYFTIYSNYKEGNFIKVERNIIFNIKFVGELNEQ